MTTTAPKRQKSRLATQIVPRVIGGYDGGNHTTCFVSYKADSKGSAIEDTQSIYMFDSWVYEHIGSLSNLNALSNSQGTTFRYVSGNPDFVDRVFVCGRSAVLTRGVTEATLIGDNRINKIKYGLPMLLHSLVSKYDYPEFEAVIVSCIDNMNLAYDLKNSCCGNHTIEILHSRDSGDIESETVRIKVDVAVTQEGRGSLWYLSGAGTPGQHPINFSDVAVVVDGGGGTFDVLRMQEGKLLESNAVGVGGNAIIDNVLASPTFRSRFPSNIEPDRGIISKAIRDGSWTYVSGDCTVHINFADEGLRAIETLLPTWQRTFDSVTRGQAVNIDNVVLTGGLFLIHYKGDPENDDESLRSSWSFAEIFRQHYAFKFVTHENAAALNALGNAELAKVQSALKGVPLVVGK